MQKYRQDLLIKNDDNSSTAIFNQKLEQLEVSTQDEKPEQKKWKNLNNLVNKLGGIIVQKYIKNPCLINNRKFDIRYFMLVACCKPFLVLTNPGYLRISLEEYQTTGFGKGG